jgi:hypothetical protein
MIAPIWANIIHKTNWSTIYPMHPKHEFHLTLIGRHTWAILLEKESLYSVIIDFLHQRSNIDLWDFSLSQEYYHIYKEYAIDDIRESIVQAATIPSLAWLYQELNALTWLNLPIPWPHVTLATTSNNPATKNRGIWLYSIQDFEKYICNKLPSISSTSAC